MRAVDLIRRKRDSAELSRDEIRWLIDAYTRGEIPDYQMSAWLMAVVWRGMTRPEIAALTEAMLYSGRVLDFSGPSDEQPGKSAGQPLGKLPGKLGKLVDKHSTGGVGDKTSLVLAPIAAAGGLRVPMISGRGLGHSGGTLDKLESIPGFNVNLSLDDFRRVLDACGCAMIGQTTEIAPADKKIYALRDVTGTVESPGLICSSIMSKKLAEGIDALVLDVKTGSGAFMKRPEDAANLAELLVETGVRMGKRVVALITDMDQPLGGAAGNALEVLESLEVLNGGGPADTRELCLELAGWMFYLGERSASPTDGKQLAAEQISSGRARDKFREIIRLQGGDPGVVDDPGRLPRAAHTLDVGAAFDGYLAAIECEQLGRACVALGGGREKKEDAIDPAVGLIFHRKVGDEVRRGEPLCTLHYNSPQRLDAARQLVESAYRIAPESPPSRPLVQRVIGA
jgi:pyrimidine-nucleoside phosphorylase